MIRKFVPAVLAISVALSPAAFAAQTTDSAALKAMDEGARTITLADGKVFTVPASFDWSKLAGYRIGDKVTVVFDEVGTAMELRTISPAS